MSSIAAIQSSVPSQSVPKPENQSRIQRVAQQALRVLIETLKLFGIGMIIGTITELFHLYFPTLPRIEILSWIAIGVITSLPFQK